MSKRDDNTPPEYTQDEIPQDDKIVNFPQQYNGDRSPINMETVRDWDYIDEAVRNAGVRNKEFLEYCKDIAKVSPGGKPRFVRIEDDTDPEHPGIIKKKFTYPTSDDIDTDAEDEVVPTMEDGKLKFRTKAYIWKKYPGKIHFQKMAFLPKPDMYVSESNEIPQSEDGVLNLYLGMSTRPIAGNCTPILNHLYKIVCTFNDRVYDYVLNWFARLVQYPQLLGETVIIFKGGQGSGKNVILDMFLMIFASHSYSVSKASDLTPRFNAHRNAAVFVLGNEISQDDGKPLNIGELKAAITQQYFMMEKKYHDPEMAKNRMTLAITTNSENVVEMDNDDRRFLLIEISDEMQGNSKYFEDLFKHIYEDGGMEAFLDMLLKRNISNFNTREIPYAMSKTQLETKMRSSKPYIQWLMEIASAECLWYEAKDASNPVCEDLLRGWNDGDQVDLPTKEAYDTYKDFCSESKLKKDSFIKFRRDIIDFLRPYGLTYDSRKSINRENARGAIRKAVFVMPSLSECKRALGIKIKETIPWDGL